MNGWRHDRSRINLRNGRCVNAAARSAGIHASNRMRALWAGAKHAGGFASSDVVQERFTDLGLEFGTAKLGRNAAADVRHVVGWACRGLDPFGSSPCVEVQR